MKTPDLSGLWIICRLLVIQCVLAGGAHPTTRICFCVLRDVGVLTTVLFICTILTVIYAIPMKCLWEARRMVSAWKITLLADNTNWNVFHQPGFWENMGRHFLYSRVRFKLERPDKTTTTACNRIFSFFTLKCIVCHFNSATCITVSATNGLSPLKFRRDSLKFLFVFLLSFPSSAEHITGQKETYECAFLVDWFLEGVSVK